MIPLLFVGFPASKPCDPLRRVVWPVLEGRRLWTTRPYQYAVLEILTAYMLLYRAGIEVDGKVFLFTSCMPMAIRMPDMRGLVN